MASHYGTWSAAWAHLDKDVYTSQRLDTVKLGECVETAEAIFDNRLRAHFDVPFDASDNPESFDIAVKVTSRLAAASYYEWANQAEAKDEQSWYPKRLRAEAEEFYKMLETRRVPEDADEAADPHVYIPTDGKTVAVNPALFSRSRITGGSGHW